MNKIERLFHIMNTFDVAYPDADCSLDYVDPWQLLVSGILATQCTDKRVNMVTPALFQRYPDVYAFAEADDTELEGYIRSTGFYRNKTKNIISAAKRICAIYDGEVPNRLEDLITLDGVGRKIANLIMGDAFGQPSVVIDTHAKRLFFRMGFTKNTDPTKIEFDMKRIIPPERSTRLCHQIVEHGRAVCTARKWNCESCCVEPWCKKVIEEQ